MSDDKAKGKPEKPAKPDPSPQSAPDDESGTPPGTPPRP